MTEPIPELPGQTTIDDLLGELMNYPFSASERRWLEEPDRACDVLGCQYDAEPESILCARHEDEVYDYRNGDNDD